HLLPVMAKVVERIMLQRLENELVLEDTQYGSRKKRSCQDAVCQIKEFMKYNEGKKQLLLSMDVEGGFDNIDIDLLCDFLVARDVSRENCQWIRRWTQCRSIRFRFNGRISTTYSTNRGVPQGSPLSPFLFVAYVADIFKLRFRCIPGLSILVSSYVDDGTIMVA